jgi:hypothetical protein
MNRIRRTAGALKDHTYSRWRGACLRQATQLNCNPLGIIVGLAVMVGTIEIWHHGGYTGTLIILIAAPAAIALIALTIVRLLRPMVIVGSRPQRKRSTAHKRPAPLPPAQPAHNGVLPPGPDSGERLGEPERVKEPV